MPSLIYIHGFLSSPASFKAQLVQQWLAAYRPDVRYHCPYISPYPLEAARVLEAVVADCADKPLFLIGSSLGGFWATWLAEKYDLRAVLINPATDPYLLDPDYIDVPLQNYHDDQTYRLNRTHLQQLVGFDVSSIQRKQNYWLLVQTGDETLDYRLAVRKYSGCRQTVIDGGDHAFQGCERFIGEFLRFFERAGDD